MSTALVSATPFIPPQIEGANFLNLMIIDDERSIREVCKEVAQSMGFNSCVADSAEHGYRMLETQNIDVVLLDLKLPGAGGLEALHQIKARRGCSNCRGDWIRDGAVSGAGYEKWRLRLRNQAIQHGGTTTAARTRGQDI